MKTKDIEGKWYSVKIWLNASADTFATSEQEVQKWLEEQLDETVFDWEITMSEVEEIQ